MLTAEEISRRVPLITVTSLKAFEENRTTHALSTVSPDSTARQVEALCELEPSKYFFAALTEPSFGGIALVYGSDFAPDVSGSANPYDTGGTLKGHCLPFSDIADRQERERRVKQLLHATLTDVPGWRAALENYLSRFYSEAKQYIQHKKTDLEPDDAPTDLPALRESPEADPRAWTWEVRLYSRVSLIDNLNWWACDDATETRLRREASSTSLPVGAQSEEKTIWQTLASTPNVVRMRKYEAFAVLTRKVQDEVLE